MDTITIKSLSFRGKHGYYEQERSAGNNFEVDVQARGNFKQSIENDNLSGTFNYELAESAAKEVFSGPPEKLIEKLCYKIGEKIFGQAKNVEELKVTVRKLNPPLAVKTDYAEITMEWKR